MKDIIKFVYSAFNTIEVLDHICIVFTNCDNPKTPNRQTKRTEYMDCVRQYLSEISGVTLNKIPAIPIYFVDCYPEEDNTETKENLKFFLGWTLTRKPLSTNNFKPVQFQEQHVEEFQKHVSVGTEKRGDTTYEKFEDRKRIKIIPNNKDPVRYSNWECIKKYEEPIKKEIIEKKNNVDLGYKYSNDGSIRYKVTVDQQRKIIRDLRTGRDIEVSPWYNASEERKKEAGRKAQTEETRQRRYERKEVQHHDAHSMFGFSSSPHTHYDIYHITMTEKRLVQTDYDGKQNYTQWLIVPGSEIKQNVGGGTEHGWTQAYQKEI